MKLVVMRHGETDFNREGRYQGSIDTPLNESGRDQARRAIDKVKTYGIDHVVASPLVRARETADIVVAHLQTPIVEHAAFVERNFGILEGLTRPEILSRHADIWKDGMNRQMHASPPGGESLFELGIRVRDGIGELATRFSGETVLLVCHGGVARAINGIIRRPFDDEYFAYVLGNAELDLYPPPLAVDPPPLNA